MEETIVVVTNSEEVKDIQDQLNNKVYKSAEEEYFETCGKYMS